MNNKVFFLHYELKIISREFQWLTPYNDLAILGQAMMQNLMKPILAIL